MKLKIQIQMVPPKTTVPVSNAPIDWRKVILFMAVILSPVIGWWLTTVLLTKPIELAKPIELLVKPIELLVKPIELLAKPIELLAKPIELAAADIVILPSANKSVVIDKKEQTNKVKLPVQLEASLATVISTEEKWVMAGDNLSRMILTSAIVDREPSDDLGHRLKMTAQKRLYFFTEVQGLAGQKIIHRWILNNKIVATIDLSIGSQRWRTHSSKNITTQMQGKWLIEVINGQGLVISQYKFDYYH